MDGTNRIKWTILAVLGVGTTACGGNVTTDSGPHRGPGGGSNTDPAGCKNPTAVVVNGEETGFVDCHEGYSHRARKTTCQNLIDKTEGPILAAGLMGTYECELHSDCDGELSYCSRLSWYPGTMCVTGCRVDEDCDEGSICECGDPIGTCRVASCATDADCDDGQLCASDDDPSCGQTPRFACTHENDVCRSRDDCSDDRGCSLQSGERSCQPVAICGRPFWVNGQNRQATLRSHVSFSELALKVDTGGLAPVDRRAVAAHYLAAAKMEHASVAAFSRFVLQLLSLGAPAELLESASQAQLDEVEHAKICFSLAEAYSGERVGPGALDMTGVLSHLALREIVELCILEGCIGETLAAVEASQAAMAARDPVLSSLLGRIAGDESRHAALSYQFVRWALCQEPELKDAVEAMFARAIDSAMRSAHSSTGAVHLAAHGLLGARALVRARADAIRDVVVPCQQALFHGPEHEQSIAPSPIHAQRVV